MLDWCTSASQIDEQVDQDYERIHQLIGYEMLITKKTHSVLFHLLDNLQTLHEFLSVGLASLSSVVFLALVTR